MCLSNSASIARSFAALSAEKPIIGSAWTRTAPATPAANRAEEAQAASSRRERTVKFGSGIG